jgi:hypothetical protein
VTSYMNIKHDVCTPDCVIASVAEKHLNVDIFLQQPSSVRLLRRIALNMHVPLVVPSKTKKGEMPSDEPRAIIR